MSEIENTTPADDDDVQGHAAPMKRLSDDESPNIARIARAGEDDDVEGHIYRAVESDDDDVQGHMKR